MTLIESGMHLITRIFGKTANDKRTYKIHE